MIKIPAECYKEFGADLDGCSTQEREGCGACHLAKRKPTNADKIRGMSDTELAEWICGVYDDDESAGKFINGILIERYDEDIMLDWLQQPAETEGTE